MVLTLTMRPPIWPGTMSRTGNPWSGSRGSPFIAQANEGKGQLGQRRREGSSPINIPFALSSAQLNFWLVPYGPLGS